MGLDKLIGVSWVSMCVALCVEPVLEVEGEREEIKWLLESPRKPSLKKKWRLERNNKERLKNNILIKIEFWDAKGIVK